MTKSCLYCGKDFSKTSKESYSQFSNKRYCNFVCFGAIQSKRLKGTISPMKGKKHNEVAKLKNREAHLGVKSFLYKHGQSKTSEYRRIKAIERRALELKAEGSFTIEQWVETKNKFNCKCAVCSIPENKMHLTVDHITPLTKGGSNFISNIQPLCQPCNSRKGNRI